MKIAYAADIHGDFEALEAFSKFTEDVDLKIIAGDIIHDVFFPKEIEFYFNQIMLAHGAKNGLSEEIVKLYDDCLKKAEQRMKEAYERFAKIISSSVPTFILPGNHDGTPLQNILAEKNLHKNGVDFNGIKIAGYGGALDLWQRIPPDILFRFEEKIEETSEGIGLKVSEPYEFFMNADPDIAVVHEQPFDFEKKEGSIGILGYALGGLPGDEREGGLPNLLLYGHTHEEEVKKMKRIGSTYKINPGALCRNFEEGGKFMIITLDESYFEEAQPYKIDKEGKIEKSGKKFGLVDDVELIEETEETEKG